MGDGLRGRRVLVTGAGGFLGDYVLDELHRRGAVPVAAAGSAVCDLRDERAVAGLFATARPDLVLHLAARVGGIGANRRRPGTFFYDNMAMGLHVIEAARRAATAKVVVAGTVCSYPKFCPVPFREDDLWDGYPEETNAAYGVAKKALLVMAQAYRQEFGLNAVFALPANLYGPRDHFDPDDSHVVPAMVRAMVTARRAGDPSVTLWGDGTPTREFLFVEDAARGLCDVAEGYDDPAPINLGSGVEVSMAALASRVAAAAGYEGEIAWDVRQPNGQPRRRLDVSRARALLGFEARVPLDEGLARTVAWFETHGAGADGARP